MISSEEDSSIPRFRAALTLWLLCSISLLNVSPRPGPETAPAGRGASGYAVSQRLYPGSAKETVNMGWSESYWDDVKSELAQAVAVPEPAGEDEAATEAGCSAEPSGAALGPDDHGPLGHPPVE